MKNHNKLRNLVFESIENKQEEKQLLTKPDTSQYHKEYIKKVIEENISKDLTKAAEFDLSDYREEIVDAIINILHIHHVDLPDDIEEIATNTDFMSVLQNISVKIVCQVQDIDELINSFKNSALDEEDENSDQKIDEKKIEKTAESEKEEEEPTKKTVDESYTLEVISDHGRYIQESINLYEQFYPRTQLLKEYCKAQNLEYKKIDQNKLYKAIHV